MTVVNLFVATLCCALLAPQPKEVGVKLSASLARESDARISALVTLENLSASTVYIATDPITTDARKSIYVSLDGDTLILASRLYEPTDPLLYQNAAGVRLQRLEPGERYVHRSALSFPLSRTRPPYVPASLFSKRIAISDFKKVVVQWGVFTSNAQLERVLKAKVEKGHVNGAEPIPPGRNVLGLQSIVTVEVPNGAR